jgi:hypothetical protein
VSIFEGQRGRTHAAHAFHRSETDGGIGLRLSGVTRNAIGFRGGAGARSAAHPL